MSTPDAVIQEMIDDLWTRYDTNASGVLEKPQVKAFIADSLEAMGAPKSSFSDERFEEIFLELDTKKTGYVDKEEMTAYLKTMLGA